MKRKVVVGGLLVMVLVGAWVWRAPPDTFRGMGGAAKPDDIPPPGESKQDMLPARRRDEFKQALVLIQAAEELGKPENDEPGARTGQKLSAQTYRQAAELLKGVLHDVPDFAPAWWALGVAYENLGGFAEAEKAYGKLLDSKDQRPESEEQQAHVRQRIIVCKRRQQAAAERTPAEKIPVQQATRLIAEASACEQCGEYDAGIKILLEVLKSYPTNTEARYRLAHCYRGKGDKANAIAEFRRVAKSDTAGESLVAEACELVEKLSLPDLTPGLARRLGEAVAYNEAAKSVWVKAYQLSEGRYSGVALRFDAPPQFYATEEEKARWYADEVRREEKAALQRYAKVGKLTLDKASQARTLLEGLMKEQPDYWPAYAQHGLACQLCAEVRFDSATFERMAGRDSFEKYLGWYRGLDLPDTAKVRDIRSRSRELESLP
jgi:tetratricopeptide (TPR) repeat protein